MTESTALPQVAPEFNLEEMFEAGCHFGHQVNRWHPKMREWIFGEHEGIHIIDLEKTAKQLALAYNTVYQLASQGKSLLVVGTKRQAKEIIEQAGQTAKISIITSRWPGGLFTNWPQVKKSIDRMRTIESGLESGAFKGLTKYELVQKQRELSRLKRFFAGLDGLTGLPDMVLVIDPQREKNAVKECNTVGVPIMALIDTNGDPSQIDMAIPANDDANKSIAFIVDHLAAAYAAGAKVMNKAVKPGKEQV